MTIDVTNESGARIEELEFVSLARHVLDALHVHPQAELEIRFVTRADMKDLNEQWMAEEGPTDVLSFPMDELRPGVEGNPSEEGILGSAVHCPQAAAEQARAAGHPAAEELLLPTTHGGLPHR